MKFRNQKEEYVYWSLKDEFHETLSFLYAILMFRGHGNLCNSLDEFERFGSSPVVKESFSKVWYQSVKASKVQGAGNFEQNL